MDVWADLQPLQLETFDDYGRRTTRQLEPREERGMWAIGGQGAGGDPEGGTSLLPREGLGAGTAAGCEA